MLLTRGSKQEKTPEEKLESFITQHKRDNLEIKTLIFDLDVNLTEKKEKVHKRLAKMEEKPCHFDNPVGLLGNKNIHFTFHASVVNEFVVEKHLQASVNLLKETQSYIRRTLRILSTAVKSYHTLPLNMIIEKVAKDYNNFFRNKKYVIGSSSKPLVGNQFCKVIIDGDQKSFGLLMVKENQEPYPYRTPQATEFNRQIRLNQTYQDCLTKCEEHYKEIRKFNTEIDDLLSLIDNKIKNNGVNAYKTNMEDMLILLGESIDTTLEVMSVVLMESRLCINTAELYMNQSYIMIKNQANESGSNI